MAVLELLEDRAATITLVADVLPASAAVTIYPPTSTTAKQAATVATLESVGSGGTATISAVTSQTEITVDDATGIDPGDRLWLTTSDGWQGPVIVSEVASTAITLEAPPPGTIAINSTLVGMKLSATVTAATTADRGLNYRAEWAVTDATGDVHAYQQMIDVVRMQFRTPVTAGEVYRYTSKQWPSAASARSAGEWVEVADRASDRVRRRIRAGGAREHLVGDHDAFVDAGMAALRIELARVNLYPQGADPAEYSDVQERALSREIRLALDALQWIDDDDDGRVDVGEVKTAYHVRMRRT